MCSTNLFLMQAIHLPVDLGAGLLVLVMVYLGLLPALIPGNVGPFYFFASTAMAVYYVPLQERVAFAVLLHAIVTLPPLLMAAIYLLFSRIKK